MSQRSPAWPVYDIFETADGEQIFIGAVTDSQWHVLCKAFSLDDLAADPALATQAARVAERARTLPRIAEAFRRYTRAGLTRRCEELGLPFAPIGKPADLFADPHLNASGGLLRTRLADGSETKLPALPIVIDGEHCGLRRDPPRPGEHDTEIVRELGLGEAEIAHLREQGVIV